MSIKRTIITTIVALALVAVVAPAVTQGVTIDELMAQISQLQTQLLALQGSGATPVPTGTVACNGVTFTRNLYVGLTGSDVKCLQVLLNNNGFTIAQTGAGSPGAETSYFGQLTLASVKAFQVSKGWTPANQVGPLTRAALNALINSTSSTSGTPVTTLPQGCTSTSGFSPVTGASCATGVVNVVPTGAGLTVQLASNNPAAGTIVDGQALAPLARLTFVNGDTSEVKVTALKLKRMGVSADASLVNTYLFDGATRITDGAAVSSTVINFNNTSGLFTIPAGGYKTISILSDVNGTSGETMGVQVVASTDVTTNASSINGTFPITGNLFTLATGTLAGVEFNASTTPSAASIDPQNDYSVWQNSVVITTRAVDMTRISFRKTGSVKDGDLQNFRLYVDGVQVGSTIPNITLSANNESLVTFDLTSSPKRLEAGTRVIKLLADIIGGSSLNFTFHLWNVADSTFIDTQYAANVLPDLISDASFTKRSSGEQTVGSGTITITKMTTSPSGDVVNLASNALLAKFQLKAAGEKVKIETLYVSARVNTGSVSGLRNGMLLANGVQIGSTTTLYDPDDSTYDYTTFNLGSSLIVDPAAPVTLEVRADIYDTGTSDTTNSIVVGSTIQVAIEGSASWNNATGQTSSTTIDAPAADVTGGTLTVASGGLTLSKYSAYTDQNAVPPLTDYKLAHYTLTANTTEAVNINTVEIGLDDVSSFATNLYFKLGNNISSTKATVAVTNTWSVNYTLAAGQTVDVMVYGDVNSLATGNGVVGMYIAGTTASSATSTTQGTSPQIGGSTIVGQTITWASGSMTTAVDGSTPLNQAVAGNQSVVAGRFKFTASNDSYTIKELKFIVAGNAATSAVINSLTLKDGSTVLATVPYDVGNTRFYITGLTVAVPANTTKVLTAEYNLSTPYTDGKGGTAAAATVTTGLNAKLTLDNAKVADSQGTETDKDDNRIANYTYVYKSIPTFTHVPVTGQGGLLTAGSTLTLYKFNVKADAKGPVALKQIRFAIDVVDNAAAASAPTLDTFQFYRGSTNISSSVSIIDPGENTMEDTTSNLDENDATTIYVVFNTEETINAGSTNEYSLRARAQGFGGSADADSISVSIAEDTVPADGTDDGGAVGANQTGYFLGAASTSGIQTLETYAGIGTAAGTGATSNANIIWSDNSAQLHDYAYDTTSSDWFNSYLLESLPMTSVGINYNN